MVLFYIQQFSIYENFMFSFHSFFLLEWCFSLYIVLVISNIMILNIFTAVQP